MPGSRNLITDVAGILVGNAADGRLASGVTVALFEEPVVASGLALGGAPAHRDAACLEPEMAVERVNAVVLSGGSGFGLDAASGVQAFLRERGIGIQVGRMHVPVVPQAICFDLLNGGDKAWGRYPPYRELAYEAVAQASADFALGSHGGGHGATTVDLKGGLGSASTVTPSGYTIGALVIVNAIGSAVVGDGPHSGPPLTRRTTSSAGSAGRRRSRRRCAASPGRAARSRARPSASSPPTPTFPRAWRSVSRSPPISASPRR